MDVPGVSFGGRTVWITGGSSGLGFAAAEAMTAAGARCVLLARDTARGKAAADRLSQARFVTLDVTDAERCLETLGNLLRDGDSPDAVVHAAGVLIREDLPETTPASVRAVMGPSFDGAINVLRTALPAMTAKGRGAVVLTSSYLAFRGGFGAMPVYSAAKAALIGLTKSLAVRYGPNGVRVNAILPAFIETPLNADVFESAPDPAARRRETAARFPLRRYGRPQDFASAALFLASDAASWITGHGLVLDGGLTA